MKEIKKITTTFKENNNRDYKETYRELATEKRLSDIVGECMSANTDFKVFDVEKEINIYDLPVRDYMELGAKFVSEVEKIITEVRSDSANIYKSKMQVIVRL